MFKDFHKNYHKIIKLGQTDLVFTKYIGLIQKHLYVKFEPNCTSGYGGNDENVIFKVKVVSLITEITVT